MTMIVDKENLNPYKSSSFKGRSLWMCPSGIACETFKQIISETAEECGTYGDFLPHVTLVAALEKGDAVEKTRELASMIAPYEFQVDKIDQRDAYFQSVFMKLKTTPQVLQANALAREVFHERQNDAEYMPHLSLVYGDFETEQKNEIIRRVDEKLKNAKAPTTFTVDSIQIWSTEGNVEDWYLVESVPLTGSSCSTLPEKNVPVLPDFAPLVTKSTSFFIPEDSVPDLLESPDVSPDSTLTKEEANDLASFMNTAMLGQRLASALFKKVEKSISCPELLHEESDFWTALG